MSAIEVTRNGNETSSSVLRRFTKRVSGSGDLKRVRKTQYAERAKSTLKQKNEALKRLTRSAEYERLRKLGKIKDVFRRK